MSHFFEPLIFQNNDGVGKKKREPSENRLLIESKNLANLHRQKGTHTKLSPYLLTLHQKAGMGTEANSVEIALY